MYANILRDMGSFNITVYSFHSWLQRYQSYKYMSVKISQSYCLIYRQVFTAHRVYIPVAEFFGEAEVAYLEVSLPIQQEVLRLEVAVDDGQWVEVVEHERDLGRVEHGRDGVEATGVPQVREQFAAADVLEYHVQVLVIVLSAQPIVPR